MPRRRACSNPQEISLQEPSIDQKESLSEIEVSDSGKQEQGDEIEQTLMPKLFHAEETYEQEAIAKYAHTSDQPSLTHSSWVYGASMVTLTLISYYIFG